jgi:hypothetical protein
VSTEPQTPPNDAPTVDRTPLTPKERRELDRMRADWATAPDPGTIDMFPKEPDSVDGEPDATTGAD